MCKQDLYEINLDVDLDDLLRLGSLTGGILNVKLSTINNSIIIIE